MTNPNDPITAFTYIGTNGFGDSCQQVNSGLTIREHFAAKAMQGILSNSEDSDVPVSYMKEVLNIPKYEHHTYGEIYPSYVAKMSVKYSDALIEALNKTNQ